jgi:hypothetical protein
MSYGIVISCFAAVVISLSCMATDASARGGGGGGGGGGGKSGGTTSGFVRGPTSSGGTGSRLTPQIGILGGPTGGGVAAGARFFGPASYNSNAACGRYPYPPCKKAW